MVRNCRSWPDVAAEHLTTISSPILVFSPSAIFFSIETSGGPVYVGAPPLAFDDWSLGFRRYSQARSSAAPIVESPARP